MKKRFGILICSSLLFLGCQKQASSPADNGAFSSQSACSGPVSGDPAIMGLDQLKSGQSAQLSLTGVSCKDAQNAQWEIAGVNIGSGPEVRALIQGTGIFEVQVILPGGSLNSQNKTVQSQALTANVAVTNSQILLSGPQVGIEDEPLSFSLTIPNGVQLSEAQWDFGDGTGPVSSLGPVTHNFIRGTYTITVTTTDSNSQTQVVHQNLTVIPLPDGRVCPLDQLTIAGPTEVPVGRRVPYSLSLSTCLQSVITNVTWDFGDGTAPANALQTTHTYLTAGTYTLTAQFNLYGSTVTLQREIVVSDNLETMPGPTPDPVNKCPSEGATQTIDGASSTESMTCGLNGTKTNTYQTRTTQTCQMVNGILDWVDTSTEQVLVSEGDCQSQSCELLTNQGKEILKDGESRVLYLNSNPAGSCSSEQVTRTCNNGVLSGSDQAQNLSCHSGCGDFGANGTVKTGVVTGEIRQPVSCQFGETGVTSTYQEISDLSCQDGQIISSNTRQGEIQTAGVCPTYNWVATDNYTSCSADCGGSQSRIYECRNQLGAVSPAERCVGSAPVESRVCDGNPQNVTRTESSEKDEEAPSCGVCPRNQIGVVVQKRQITTVKTYACVNHEVQVAHEETQNGTWVKESYCRDFVPMRCSHDSLSNDDAKGRYAWMKKCEDQIPAVKEFLERFQNKKYHRYGINRGSRRLYPTFMDSETEKPWIAPVSSGENCKAPASVYVAAVCVSSCSTPEQQILVQAQNEAKLKYTPFIEALTAKVPRVATLHSASSMSSKNVTTTNVDNWVTELVDENHDILVFKMKSGGQLKVTLNHPILSQDGVMKLASDFKVGESLVQLGGNLDEIVSIEPAVHYGKVYNLFVKSSDLKKNVVVINGYLSGTAFYQNEGAQFLNRSLFREQLFRGAFDSKGGR